jgi:hypothetical protein
MINNRINELINKLNCSNEERQLIKILTELDVLFPKNNYVQTNFEIITKEDGLYYIKYINPQGIQMERSDNTWFPKRLDNGVLSDHVGKSKSTGEQIDLSKKDWARQINIYNSLKRLGYNELKENLAGATSYAYTFEANEKFNPIVMSVNRSNRVTDLSVLNKNSAQKNLRLLKIAVDYYKQINDLKNSIFLKTQNNSEISRQIDCPDS